MESENGLGLFRLALIPSADWRVLTDKDTEASLQGFLLGLQTSSDRVRDVPVRGAIRPL